MWTALILNPESIQSIYGYNIPIFEIVLLQRLTIVTGDEIMCDLQISINELPANLPAKWKARSVNAVQLNLQLISCQILSLEMYDGQDLGKLQIESINDLKLISFIAGNKKVFSIRSKWIRIESITGYNKGSWQSVS